MGRNKSGADTLLRHWHMLREVPRYPHKIAVSELRRLLNAVGFEVTARTIQRDLLELSSEFPLLADERERPYGWSWHKDAPAFDLPNLSNEGALAFAMVERYLHPLLPHTLLSQLQPHFALASKRLAGAAPRRGSHGWLGKVAVVQPNQALIPPRIDPVINATVTDALLGDRQVRIGYLRRGEAKVQDYVLSPLGLVQRGPVIYIVGTLFEYADVRLFALHRIRQAKMLGTAARRPQGFELERYLASGALDYGSGKRVRLEAVFDTPAAEHLHETPLATDQRLDVIDADHTRLRPQSPTRRSSAGGSWASANRSKSPRRSRCGRVLLRQRRQWRKGIVGRELRMKRAATCGGMLANTRLGGNRSHEIDTAAMGVRRSHSSTTGVCELPLALVAGPMTFPFPGFLAVISNMFAPTS